MTGVACLSLLPATATAHQDKDWTFDKYGRAMQASGRRTDLTERTFEAVRQKRAHALQQLETYLAGKFGNADLDVMRAFSQVPREYYHFNYSSHGSFAREAYDWYPRPWAIGFGSALSDFLGQAYMTQLARPKAGETALEIGTGSGYQISILSRIVRKACSIEIIEPLGTPVGRIFKPLGFDNIESRVGDGYFGWPQEKDGFDIIMVTCVAQHVPPDLLKQLKPGSGRLIIPVGQPFKREQVLYVFSKDADGRIQSRRDVGVYFIPMTGRIARGRSA
ncbi:protein-L-isoaspartate O-methyltransferase [Reyranella sp. CPCC 100927]|uniref:protein-L-isoaspartate O-methyltransferase family protein n=1 Tax=Reyranella sp. CPCC 100927 TaxID=2599616 RepID=UPI001C49A113|nr:protein-L-isoaspartate O-methyltransferase [Reyranella sp. CPCC 100927]